MYRAHLLFALFVCVFASCNKNKTGQLDMEFQTQILYESSGLMDSFPHTDGYSLKLELLRFYISDIILVTEKGEERLVEEIALVTIDANGTATLDLDAPYGKYEKIRFGIGVPANLNEADPSNYNSEGHPLNPIEGMYWDMNSMYRFVSMDGRYDLEPDGTYDGTFSYHTGFEESYRTYEFEFAERINDEVGYEIGFYIDLYTIFSNPGNEIDVPVTPYYHGNTSDLYLSIMLSDNFQASVRLQ